MFDKNTFGAIRLLHSEAPSEIVDLGSRGFARTSVQGAACHGAAAEKFLPAKTIDKSIGDAMSINVLATVVMAGLCQAGLINLKATQQGTDWSKVSNGEAAANLSDKLFSMSHSQ